MIDLTVVTVCRNAGDKLVRTINSVLHQKNKGSISIEHIIIDGASMDGSLNYLEQEKAKGNIEVLVSEPDEGMVHAMNKGLWLARGKAIVMLNAGDTFNGQDIKECVMPIVRNETHHTAAIASLTEEAKTEIVGYKLALSKYMYLFTPYCHQSYFLETKAMQKIRGMDTQYECAADADLCFQMYKRYGAPLFINKVVTNYELGGHSANELDEFYCDLIWYKWHFFHEIEKRMQQDEEYAQATCYALLLDTYKLCHGYEKQHWKELAILTAMVERTYSNVHNARLKTALAFIEKVILPVLDKCKTIALALLYPCEKAIRVVNPPIELTGKETAKELFEQ